MGLVTGKTTLLAHGIGMGQMAILAGLNLSVEPMTGTAGKLAVNTWKILQLLILGRMTTEAWFCYISLKMNIKGLMGITMTGNTALNFKMSFSLMTLTAKRNYFHISRRMPLMTINT